MRTLFFAALTSPNGLFTLPPHLPTPDGPCFTHELFAHPVKRWFCFLFPKTVWIDDVQVWKVNWRGPQPKASYAERFAVN